MSYAVNEDGLTVYDTVTGEAVCICGPARVALAFNENEQTQKTYAFLIAKLLNEGKT